MPDGCGDKQKKEAGAGEGAQGNRGGAEDAAVNALQLYSVFRFKQHSLSGRRGDQGGEMTRVG